MRLEDIQIPGFPPVDTKTPLWARVKGLQLDAVINAAAGATVLLLSFMVAVDLGMVQLKMPLPVLFLSSFYMLLAAMMGYDMVRAPRLFSVVFPLSVIAGLMTYAAGGTALYELRTLIAEPRESNLVSVALSPRRCVGPSC